MKMLKKFSAKRFYKFIMTFKGIKCQTSIRRSLTCKIKLIVLFIDLENVFRIIFTDFIELSLSPGLC